ncbi:MAG: glycerol kinase, partial [Myxococcales bacterium]|nr:glycerol kinase [Myxococcales bacterium]
GGELHISDVSNASRTMLMDIRSCQWNDECVEIFDVPKNCLPRIVPSAGIYGKTKGLSFLPDGIPIAALAGDQQASLFGQTCFEKGDTKATFGTGCFILMNTGNEIIFSKHGLITTIAYQIGDNPTYCLEGSAFIAGAAIQFLKDTFSLIKNEEEIESLAETVLDSDGVIFVPALCGLGAPYWLPDARGVLSGLSRGTTKGHIARAVLEGIALQNTEIMLAMTDDAFRPTVLKVDGGASQNNLLMQIQAELLGINCIRSESAQKTAQGIAYMAGLATGFFGSLEELKTFNITTKEFSPKKDVVWAKDKIKGYKRALMKV